MVIANRRGRGYHAPALSPRDELMDRDTFDATIRTFKHRTPFRPFTVAMENGDRHEVDHPDALAIRDGMALFAAPGNIPVIFDHEGVSQIVGDLVGRTSAAGQDV